MLTPSRCSPRRSPAGCGRGRCWCDAQAAQPCVGVVAGAVGGRGNTGEHGRAITVSGERNRQSLPACCNLEYVRVQSISTIGTVASGANVSHSVNDGLAPSQRASPSDQQNANKPHSTTSHRNSPTIRRCFGANSASSLFRRHGGAGWCGAPGSSQHPPHSRSADGQRRSAHLHRAIARFVAVSRPPQSSLPRYVR